MVVSINLTDEEKKLAESYAKRCGVSLEKAMKSTFFEKIEEEYDITIADSAIKEFNKNPQTHSLKELMSELDS